MSLSRKQPGLPFLLALGVLLILSASFLAVQLWSDGPTRRGAVQALEAPVMPKSLDVSKKGARSANGKKAPVVAAPVVKEVVADNGGEEDVVLDLEDQDLTDTDSANLPDEKPVVNEKPVVAPAVKAAAKADEPVASESPVKVVEPVREAKSAPAPVAKAPVVAEGTLEDSAKPVITSKPSVKKVRKAKKAKKAVVKESEDSSVVPPEWDWFSTPLKMNLKDGRLEIVPASKPRQIELLTVVAKLPEPEFAPVVVEKSSAAAAPTKSVEPAAEKPFAAAIARMAKIRHIREAREAGRTDNPVVKPAEPVNASPSMRRLGEVINELVVKLDKRVVATNADLDIAPVAITPANVEFEEAAPMAVTASGGSEVPESVDESIQFKPFYSGSGSSFSNRVNEMIRRGQYLRD